MPDDMMNIISKPKALSFDEVRSLALSLGADDAAAVSIDHPELAEERPHALKALPGARTFIALVLSTHADDIRSPRRSVANQEFHHIGDRVNRVARDLAVALSRRGFRTINPAMGFPMEMSQFPGRTWIVSHKRVAQAAQLGRMGLHRNLIHPKLGSFVLLGTVITTAAVEGEAQPLTYNPCVTCKLCVAACPVGAIEPDGAFRFSACYDHNYREFMTGFGDFVEEVADSKGRAELRERVDLSEMSSMWQSLAYGPNYKAAYCIAACPAGEQHFAPFAADRPGYLKDVVRPLTEQVETVYVVKGSDAEEHVRKRFPHKTVKVVRSSLRPTTARGFVAGAQLTFQRRPARGWRATFHFDLGGDERVQATMRIDDGTLTVSDGLEGEPDVVVSGDGRVWAEVASKQRSAVWAVLTRKLRVKGNRALLDRFAACFPR
jgi:epoxyqueuosine reductase QueG